MAPEAEASPVESVHKPATTMLVTPPASVSGFNLQGNRVKRSRGDEAREKVVIPCCDLAPAAQGVLAGNLSEQVMGHVFNGGEIGRGVIGPDAALVIAADHVHGRVEMWRGDFRPNISVAAPFVWRCLTGSTVAPFPHPAHRTGHADFPHPALGQDVTPSSTPRRAQAGSGVRARSTRRGARVDRSRLCVA